MVGATDEAEQTVTISSSCDLDVSVYLFIALSGLRSSPQNTRKKLRERSESVFF